MNKNKETKKVKEEFEEKEHKSKRQKFKTEIAISEDIKKQQLYKLKQKYENNEIYEKDLSEAKSSFDKTGIL